MKNITELKKELLELEERIRNLERDLKSPLSKDLEEYVTDTTNRDILYGLYQIEKKNINRIEAEIRQYNNKIQ
jgi:hypothetical protein